MGLQNQMQVGLPKITRTKINRDGLVLDGNTHVRGPDTDVRVTSRVANLSERPPAGERVADGRVAAVVNREGAKAIQAERSWTSVRIVSTIAIRETADPDDSDDSNAVQIQKAVG